MRRLNRRALALAAIGALVFAGLALAQGSGTRTTKSVSASFAATTVVDSKTTTCTGADGSYAVTHASYRGTATSGESRLNGPIEIRAHSVVNTATNLGWLDATLTARGANARISGVLAGGHLQGLAAGR